LAELERVKEDLVCNVYSSCLEESIIHRKSRSGEVQRGTDEKHLCILSIPYVRGVSEKFKTLVEGITLGLSFKPNLL
jgi:hypothetical protein